MALVRPQLAAAVIRARLDEVVGRDGWSITHQAFPDGSVGCSLTVWVHDTNPSNDAFEGLGSVSAAAPRRAVIRSAIASPGPLATNAATLGDDALARAAEQFGLVPSVDPDGAYWVPFDAEANEILHPPELPAAPRSVPETSVPETSVPKTSVPETGGTPGGEGPSAVTPKPEVQQVIDRLVERLREEGLGLQAAKLLVAYGGYGHDAAAARELYAKLRALLVQRPPMAPQQEPTP